MSDTLGNQITPIRGESEALEPYSDLRSEFQQNINGRVIRADRVDGHVFVSIDGKPFQGSFIEAIQAATKMPIRWSGVFT